MNLLEFKQQIDRLAEHFHSCAEELEVVVATGWQMVGGLVTRPVSSVDRGLCLNRRQIVIQQLINEDDLK